MRGNHRAFQKALLSWYTSNHRDLPWRKSQDPYRVLVSEFMLQQTQVSTVIPYFLRFVSEFPSIASLARAPLQKVLKRWEGLGYYTRARNLHRAAREIQKKWKGRVPANLEDLASLPGIGPYTAGAVGSIAYDLRVPILDGNVRRVLCRLYAVQEDPRQAAVIKRLWGWAEGLLPNRQAGDFNQSLMELGAVICVSGRPKCGECPVQRFCEARRGGIEDRVPMAARRHTVPTLSMWVGLILYGNKLLLGPRPQKGLLGGLWAFPELEASNDRGSKSLVAGLKNLTGLRTVPNHPLGEVAHVYSHRRVVYQAHLLKYDGKRGRPAPPWKWIPIDQIREYPLPNAARAVLDRFEGFYRESHAWAAEEAAPSYRRR